MSHLTLSQRYEISILHKNELSISDIADRIGENRSTVYRELERNSDGRNGKYKAGIAQKKLNYAMVRKTKTKSLQMRYKLW